MIATVDTNVLVSGVFFGGLPGRIVSAAREGVFTLAMTPRLLDELREVLARKKFGLTPEMVQLLMAGIEDSALIVYQAQDLPPHHNANNPATSTCSPSSTADATDPVFTTISGSSYRPDPFNRYT